MTRKINGIFCGAPNRSVFLVHGAHFLEAPEQGSGGTEAPGQDLIARFASIVESLDELKVLLSSENLDIESPEIKTAISDLRARVIKILEGSDIDIMTEDETMDIADTLLALRDNALPLIDLVEKTGDVAERKKNTNHLLGLVNRILSDKLFEVWNTKRIGIDHLTGVKDRKYGEATIQSLLSRGRDG
ncbi:hypothetical protein KKG51_00345, partial [Patescibacteria group bacterium]|nr:hypothetical protein [Patescibacteria group bacterium]